MMLQVETRLNFLVEMQYKAATTATNMSGPGAKMGFWVGTRLKRVVKCCIKQHLKKIIY